MSAADPFIDSNVVLYLLSGEALRADRAEKVVAAGGVVSVQVLNEVAAVASRKLGMSLAEIREVLAAVRHACTVVALTQETHDLGLDLAESRGIPIYDAMILASARLAGCRTLVSEDFQHGQRFNGLVVRNPFR